MEKKWTKQQQQVIELQDRNLLVSAAAGSGKTAVLVERIIQKILDSKHRIDIDQLLIVTFTNAAAAEMRERVGAAIEKALEEQPANTHLQRQQTLLHSAQITTIHSFCLYVIRNFFHRIDLEPDFRVAEEGELKLLKSDVLDKVLEKYYEEAKPEFITLSETIATGKNDTPLKDTILKLFEFAMSYPWVEDWLEDCKKPYHIESMEEFEALPLAKELLLYLKNITNQWALQIKICADISGDADGPQMYTEMLTKEAEAIQEIAKSTSYQQFYYKMRGFSFDRLAAARKFTGDVEKKERVKKLRNEVKSSMKKVTERFFFQSPEQMITDIQKNRPIADMLTEVTLAFLHAFEEKKREKNILDFNDLEHFALKILVDDETHKPTKTAAEIRKNYREIMIDEYQDSNYVQETILKAVSKESEGICNIFMVGDVKQSIYRFRMARPEIFMEKYNTYTQEKSDRQRIDLHMNFRSRPQVLNFVNNIFYRVMKEDIGDVTYDSQAALYAGAVFPEGEKGMFDPTFLVIEPDEEQKDVKAPELEARAVGMEIQKLMKVQQVTEETQDKEHSRSLRAIRYSDIVILLRSLSGWSETFVKVLGEMGIPVRAATGTGYFSAVEVQTALNLLRILDNPRQDIPMASVLTSPIVGLTGEDLARIRITYPKEKFYQAVLHFMQKEENFQSCLLASQEKKLCDFLEVLNRFRKKISYTPIHELLYQILEETGYQAYVYALPNGESKRANLEMLVEKAIAYENTSYRGLFHFIRYMEQLQKYDVDFALAEGDEAEDTVRIMSIHKSKGLEFPVVFVSGLGKTFNNQDIRERVVLHPKFGMGMDIIDISRRLKIPSITRQFLARKITLENMGEELRVLYVALTRAKEKLILTGVLKKAEEKLASLQAITTEDGFLTFLSRLNANTFMQLLLLARTCMPENYPLTLVRQGELEKLGEQQVITEGLTRIQLLTKLQESEPEWEKNIRERLSYIYPYEEEVAMKTKVSVSELKQRAMERAIEEEQIVQISWKEAERETEIKISGGDSKEETETKISGDDSKEKIEIGRERYIPSFMQEIQEENIGIKRGTAMHRILECYDFTRGPETLQEQLQELEEQRKIEKGLKDLVYLPALKKFLRTDLSMRIQTAAKQGKLYREKPFVMGKAAKDVLKESNSQEMILIQGIIDLFLEEDGEIVLLDYKTDRVKTAQQLANRYRAQLDLYQEAIERAMGKKVKERLLYSFRLGRTIEV